MSKEKPSLSLNQLAKYLNADASQKKRIIEDRKTPQTFKSIYYAVAQKKISEFIAGNCSDEEILVREIDKLYALPPKNDNQKHKFQANAQAMQSFIDFYEEVIFDKLQGAMPTTRFEKLVINGVEFSMNPNALMHGRHAGKDSMGAVKLYFSKDDKLSIDTGKFISGLLYKFLDENYSDEVKLHQRHCQVVDVFGQNVHVAPKLSKTKLQKMKDTCQEIAMWWQYVG